MQNLKRVLILTTLTLVIPVIASAVTLPWETTFNCNDWVQGSSGSCDGITLNWGGSSVDGNRTQITAAANNPSGQGGKGIRFWVGDGHNVYSGSVRVSFPSKQKEFWIRWYERWESGFRWSGLEYNKSLYFRTDEGHDPYCGFVGGNGYRIYNQGSTGPYASSTSGGWNTVYPGGVSDGSWHSYEIHMKMDTNSSDGIGEIWVDGKLVSSVKNVNWSNGSTAARAGWAWFDFHNNQATVANGRAMYVDYDDIVISTTGPIGMVGGVPPAPAPAPEPVPVPEPTPNPVPVPVPTTPPVSSVLFEESFEDSNLASRGWYDNTNLVLTTAVAAPGSSRSVEYRFPQGATKPVNGGSIRHKFSETGSVYLSYMVKYSSNWEGSNRAYHPHEFYLLTNKDGDWSNLANTHLTSYIEQNEGVPMISIQDAMNIDQTKIGSNLVPTTENRGVAGCNGDSDGYGNGDCYSSGAVYINGKSWRADSVYFSNAPGAYNKNDWHHVEAYLRLNSISNGKAVADGVIQYWFDGQPVLDYQNVVFRTGQHADMKFNQIVIGPWIGDGSPVDQTFWIDNLKLGTGPSGSGGSDPVPPPDTTPVQPPLNLRITSN